MNVVHILFPKFKDRLFTCLWIMTNWLGSYRFKLGLFRQTKLRNKSTCLYQKIVLKRHNMDNTSKYFSLREITI